MQFAVLQWLWLRSAVKRHRVLSLAVFVIIALAAYAAPRQIDDVNFREWTGWALAAFLGYLTWRQYVAGKRKDEESEFESRVKAIAKPTETHELLQSMDERMCEGFESTNRRLIDLGERVAHIEGRLDEDDKRTGPKDRRLGADDRRAISFSKD